MAQPAVRSGSLTLACPRSWMTTATTLQRAWSWPHRGQGPTGTRDELVPVTCEEWKLFKWGAFTVMMCFTGTCHLSVLLRAKGLQKYPTRWMFGLSASSSISAYMDARWVLIGTMFGNHSVMCILLFYCCWPLLSPIIFGFSSAVERGTLQLAKETSVK